MPGDAVWPSAMIGDEILPMEKIARGWKQSEGVRNGHQRIGSDRKEYGGTGENR
jgi:hypothetical protein